MYKKMKMFVVKDQIDNSIIYCIQKFIKEYGTQ